MRPTSVNVNNRQTSLTGLMTVAQGGLLRSLSQYLLGYLGGHIRITAACQRGPVRDWRL